MLISLCMLISCDYSRSMPCLYPCACSYHVTIVAACHADIPVHAHVHATLQYDTCPCGAAFEVTDMYVAGPAPMYVPGSAPICVAEPAPMYVAGPAAIERLP